MATLTLKKKPEDLTRSTRRRLAKYWLKQFPFYRDKLHPWKVGIGKELHAKYNEDNHPFKFNDVRFNLYIRRTFAEYDESGDRVDINGKKVA